MTMATKKKAPSKPRAPRTQRGEFYNVEAHADFTGGLNTANPVSIADNQLAQATNLQLSTTGLPKPIWQAPPRYSPAFSPTAVLGISPFYKSDGTTRLVMASGTSLYSDTPHVTFQYASQSAWTQSGTYTNLDSSSTPGSLKLYTPPTPTFSRSSVAYDDYGVQYASGAPRYPYLPLAGPVFQDQFTTNDISSYTSGGDTPATWTITAGSPNGTLSAVPGSNATLLVNNLSVQNVDILVNCSQAADGRIIARLQDNNDYYMLQFVDGSASSGPNMMYIVKRVGGTYTQLQSAPISFTRGTTYPIKFTVHGSQLEGWFNGVKVLSVTDTSITNSGSVGVGCGGTTPGPIFESIAVYYAQQGLMMEEGTTNLLTANQSHPTSTTGLAMSGVNSSLGTLSIVTSPSWVGGGSAKVVVSNYPSSGGDVNLATVNPSTGAENTAIAVSASTSYAFSARVLAPTGIQFALRIIQWNSSGSALGDSILTTLTGTGIQQTISGSLTTTSTTAYVSVRIRFLGNGTFYNDGLQVEQKPFATSWITGGSSRAAETCTVPTAGVFYKGNWTIEATIRINSINSSIAQEIVRYDIDSNDYFLFRIENGYLVLKICSGGTLYSITDSTQLTPGVSYAVMAAGNGSVMRLCKNGAQIGSDTSYVEPVGTLPANLGIGYYPAGGTEQLDGPITDFRISSRARTLAEHQAYVSSGLPQAWDIDTTCLLSFAGNLNQPATRQGVWQSPVQNASAATNLSTLTVTWQDTEPANTAIVCQVRTSPDGSTWSAWYNQTNNSLATAPANKYSQVRFILQEINNASTPVLQQATVFYQGSATTTQITSTMQQATHYSFAQLQNDLMIANGVDYIQQYDGTNLTALTSSPQAKYICAYQNRIWAANIQGYPSRLLFSDILNQASWPGINLIDVNPSDGDQIMALIPTQYTLLIVKQYSIYTLTGATTQTYAVSPALPGGTIAPNGALWTPYGLFLVDREGIWLTDLSKRTLISNDIREFWATLNQWQLQQAALFYYGPKQQLICAVPSANATANDTLLIYDILHKSWTVTASGTYNFACFALFYEQGQWEYLAADSTQGQVYSIGKSGSQALTATLETKHFPLGAEEILKRIKWIDLTFGKCNAATTIQLQQVADGMYGAPKTVTVPAGQEATAIRLMPTAAYCKNLGLNIQWQNVTDILPELLDVAITYMPRVVRSQVVY